MKYTCQNLERTRVIKTIQMMVNCQSVKILKRVFEYCGDLLSLRRQRLLQEMWHEMEINASLSISLQINRNKNRFRNDVRKNAKQNSELKKIVNDILYQDNSYTKKKY